MEACPFVTKLDSNDSANVNDNISAAEQRAVISMRRAAAPGNERKFGLHLDVHCMGHQFCLLARPVYEGIGDLSSIITRLSHVLQSNRAETGRLDAMDAHIEKVFSMARGIRVTNGVRSVQRARGDHHVVFVICA